MAIPRKNKIYERQRNDLGRNTYVRQNTRIN